MAANYFLHVKTQKKSIVSLPMQQNNRFPFLCFETDSDKSYIAQIIMESDSMQPTIEINANALLFVDTRVKAYVDVKDIALDE